VRSKYLDNELPHRGACHYEACAAATGRLCALFHSLGAQHLTHKIISVPGHEPFKYAPVTPQFTPHSTHTHSHIIDIYI
jgi:hypothetical protein